MNRDNIEDIYPLAPIQQGILFHTLYAPESGVYFQQFYCTLQGNVDAHALKSALQYIVDRHSVLRTAFIWESRKEPLQIVYKRVDVPFEQQDWRGMPSTEHDNGLQAFLQQDRARGFDLSKAPLMRLSLAQITADTYYFIWSYHHLLLDGWCMPILFKEFFAFYEAFCHGRKLQLQPSPPYGNYIAWLQQHLDLPHAESFWREMLNGFTAPTSLGVGNRHSPPSHASTHGHEAEIRLSAQTTNSLQSFAQQHRITVNTLLEGAWALLLSRYSNQSDMVFGVTVTGRPTSLDGVESMIGLFINTLPVRIRLLPDDTVLSLLKRLQEQQINLLQYDYTPLVEVQGWSQVPRTMPLFESIVVFENFSLDSALLEQISGLKIGKFHLLETMNYALTVGSSPGAELALQINYDNRRFEPATVHRMLGHFKTLLEEMVTYPEHDPSTLPMLTETESQTLAAWNKTDALYPMDQCFSQLFEAQVEQIPHSVAVVCDGVTLTYQQLNQRANRLAHVLKDEGIGPECIVTLMAKRGIDLLTAILAVFKAGGAYLPVDLHFPAGRLAQVIEQSRTRLVLVADLFAPLLSEALAEIDDSVRPRCLKLEEILQSTSSTENIPMRCVPRNMAYVIYTSGSTGIPKGAMVEQIGMVNHLCAKISDLHLTAADRIAQTASQSFDISVWQFLAALLVGGQVHIFSDEIAHDPMPLLTQVESQGISILETVPSLMRAMLDEITRLGVDGYPLSALRWLIPTGEALPPDLCRQWFAYYPHIPLLNAYGPTECSDDVTHHPIYDSPAPDMTRMPIGHPVANMRLYVLDAQRQPLPIEITNELYVGGVGVGRGYLNDPVRTAEVFGPDPFTTTPGARLYKTGDLACYLPDGNLDFLGRVDAQVKVRGFRIELQEIEAVLAKHPAVRDVAVVAWDDEVGDKRIVAYLVPNNDQLTDGVLNDFAKGLLPDYMIPSRFVFLEDFPRTPTGKLDRRALPAPDWVAGHSEKRFAAPRTPLEELIAGIWMQVLGGKPVSIYDNFFELGGHSLLATQVISRVRQTFRIDLPLRSLFETPTIAGLAATIEAATAAEKGQGLQLPPLVHVHHDIHERLPLSYAQQRLWFLCQLEPGSAFYNLTIAVRLMGSLNVMWLKRSLDEIIGRHEILRTIFSITDGQPVQVIYPPFSLPITHINLSGLPKVQFEDEAMRLAAEESRYVFDLTQMPLLRAALIQLGEGDHLAVLTIHHIACDAWSMGILFQEIGQLYAMFSQNQAGSLPELPTQYVDFARWQREWLQGAILDAQVDYWRQQLAGAPPVLELPTDYPRPSIQTFRGAEKTQILPQSLADELQAFSHREDVTLFMTLLAAFKCLLHYHTKRDDIIVGTDVANRNHAGIEGLIGFFVNQLVLRTDLSENPTFRKLLKRVREVLLGAYAHQDLPFDKLVEVLKPERSLKYSPLFQVKLVLWNVPASEAKLPDLTMQIVDIDKGTTQLDLNLRVGERPEGLILSAQYSTDLFAAATITRLLGQFELLLRAAIAQPDIRLSALEAMLAEADRQQRVSDGKELAKAASLKLREVKRRSAWVPRSPSQDASSTPRPTTLTHYKLPNDLEIVHLNKAETNYFYEDIFKNRAYLQHGLALSKGDCVFDVGANIGLFSLFVHQECRGDVQLYTFEPAPPLFEILKTNVELHGVNAKLFNCGISDAERVAEFTFYPLSSGMSSFCADREDEKTVLHAIMLNQQHKGMDGMAHLMEHSEELLEQRLRNEIFTCRLRTLSSVIEEQGVESIDLLKVDVQKSELAVLEGIKEADWAKIKQVVMEVHDIAGRLHQITTLLEKHGFSVVTEQGDAYKGTVIYNLYARKSEFIPVV